MKKQVATFIAGSFSNVGEGLWRDDRGAYFVGGEMPISTERIEEMDTLGELEWLSGERLMLSPSEAASEQQAHEKPQNTIGEIGFTEAEEVAEEASAAAIEPKASAQEETSSTKKKKLSLIAAIVAAVTIGIVAAVLLLGQTSDESTGEPPVVIDMSDLGLSEPEDAPEPEPVEEQELGESALESEPSFYGVTDEQFDREMGEARSDIEYYGRYADEFFPEEGFYGIWVSASRDRIEAERTLTQVLDRLFESEGLGAGLVTTSSWSNLNPDVWHAVCVGPFLSQAEAEAALAAVRAAGYSDAYVKFSGAIR